MKIFYSKSNNGFYFDYIHGDSKPIDSVEIEEDFYNSLISAQGKGKFITSDSNGYPILIDAPLATNDQIKLAKISIVQSYMDNQAKSLGYDNISVAVTYADEPSVPKFQNEGRVFREWRSLVWEKCYTILADVEAGNRVIPTDDELIAELPKINL